MTFSRTIVAGFAIIVSISSCEEKPAKSAAPPSFTQAQLQPEKQAEKASQPAMKQPKAVVISWAGPSDRPHPPLVLWSDKQVLQSAADWIAKRGSSPIGVTDAETTADALACISRATGPSSHSAFLLEVSALDGTAATTERFDGAASKAFLTAAIACVGEKSPAGGYMKSLQTMVTNAMK